MAIIAIFVKRPTLRDLGTCNDCKRMTPQAVHPLKICELSDDRYCNDLIFSVSLQSGVYPSTDQIVKAVNANAKVEVLTLEELYRKSVKKTQKPREGMHRNERDNQRSNLMERLAISRA